MRGFIVQERSELNWMQLNWTECSILWHQFVQCSVERILFDFIRFGSLQWSAHNYHVSINTQTVRAVSCQSSCRAFISSEPNTNGQKPTEIYICTLLSSRFPSAFDNIAFIHEWHHLLLLLWPRWRRLKSLSVLVNEHALRIKMIAITHIPSCMYVDRHDNCKREIQPWWKVWTQQ